MGNITLYY